MGARWMLAAIDAEEARALSATAVGSTSAAASLSSCRALLRARLPGQGPTTAVAILVQAAVIAAVVVRTVRAEPEACPRAKQRLLCGRALCPQATADDITKFFGPYKAMVVEGPLNMGGQLYPVRLSETNCRRKRWARSLAMQSESKVHRLSSPPRSKARRVAGLLAIGQLVPG